MESGYNHQYLYDLLKSEGYDVKVAHPFMVKAIAYAKLKTDKVDARILADLLRTDLIPGLLRYLAGERQIDHEAEARIAMKRQ